MKVINVVRVDETTSFCGYHAQKGGTVFVLDDEYDFSLAARRVRFYLAGSTLELNVAQSRNLRGIGGCDSFYVASDLAGEIPVGTELVLLFY